MEAFELLDGAAAEFRARLGRVAADDWVRPTPCSEWDVRRLVNHVVTANLTSERLLHGVTPDETVAMIGADLDPEARSRSGCARAMEGRSRVDITPT